MRLSHRVIEWTEEHGRAPKLVTFYNPEDMGSRVYTNIKEKKAKELGILFEKIANYKLQDINKSKTLVSEYNEDPTVDGIMVQVPMEGQNDLIDLIDPEKDVDGLREDSSYLPATVMAVVEILKSAGNTGGEVIVVGNKGQVGKKLTEVLKCGGMDKEDWETLRLKNADVIISATGQEGLIKPEMVKNGVICIDVGYPKGDFDFSVSLKASFFTPVPGGVGPVTVAMLFKNLIVQ